MRRSIVLQSIIAALGLCLILIVLSAPTAPAHATRQAIKRPNILFIIADDWSYPHAGIYGDKIVKTPNFDRVAREGALFTNSYCVSPSCTPSRAAVLTGQTVHRLEEGANLHGFLPKKFAVYPDLLEAAGYYVGYTRKGWGPGVLGGTGRVQNSQVTTQTIPSAKLEENGRMRNPAGPTFKSFEEFFRGKPADKPFCFWFGSQDPHRPYVRGTGLQSGMRLEDVQVPAFLPDTPEVRGDILDYYFEVQRFDREVGELLQLLEAAGQLDNTVIMITSDNGMPFPRAKANIRDSGSRMPLAIRWTAQVKGGQIISDFVSHADFAPTFLEAAGLKPLKEMTGRSLVGLLKGRKDAGRDHVFLERERHANVRRGDLSYPVRAIRTTDFLYVRNLRPDRWPAGDPEMYKAVGAFGDVDASPTKQLILDKRTDKEIANFFRLAFEKRPAEELFDLRTDPAQLVNVVGEPRYADARRLLRTSLDKWMRETADPRATSDDDRFDRYPYFGNAAMIPTTRQ
ncbi:MAG: sulfatase [Pyrinomonadaceae bacterium]|nr:sulfatase [Pyrinomonadaceae bacterium]